MTELEKIDAALAYYRENIEESEVEIDRLLDMRLELMEELDNAN